MVRKVVLILAAVLLLWVPRTAARKFSYSVDAVRIDGKGDSLTVSIYWTVRSLEGLGQGAEVVSPALRNNGGFVSLTPVSFYGREALAQSRGYTASGVSTEKSVFEGTDYARSFKTEDTFPRLPWMDTVRVMFTTSEWTRSKGLVQRSVEQKAHLCRPPRPKGLELPMRLKAPEDDRDQWREVILSMPVVFDPYGDLVEESSGDADISTEDFVNAVKGLFGPGIERSDAVLSVAVGPEGDGSASVERSRLLAGNVLEWLREKGASTGGTVQAVGLGENWEDVRRWVSRSRFSSDPRIAEILSIEDGRDRYELLSREKPGAMDVLRSECFPDLCRAELRIRCRLMRGGSPGMTRRLYESVPEALSAMDYYILGSSHPEGSMDRIDVFMNAAQHHPDNEPLVADAVMTLSAAGDPKAAFPYLRVLGDSDESQYALALWDVASGRYDEAFDILSRLREKNSFFAHVWDMSAPLISWEAGIYHYEEVCL